MVSVAPLYFLSKNSSEFLNGKTKIKISENNIKDVISETLNSTKDIKFVHKEEKIKKLNRNSFIQLYNVIDTIPESLEDSAASEFMLTRLLKQNMKSDTKMFLLASIDIMNINESNILDIMKVVSFSQLFRIKLGVQLSANANIDSSVHESRMDHRISPTPDLLFQQLEFQKAINDMKADDSLHINVSIIQKNESSMDSKICNRQKSYTQVPTNSEFSYELEARNIANKRAVELIQESYSLLESVASSLKMVIAKKGKRKPCFICGISKNKVDSMKNAKLEFEQKNYSLKYKFPSVEKTEKKTPRKCRSVSPTPR
jgi:hypothetical protein